MTLDFIRYRQPWRKMIVRFASALPPSRLRDRLTAFLYPDGAMLKFPKVYK
jgi:hypothetical protein